MSSSDGHEELKTKLKELKEHEKIFLKYYYKKFDDFDKFLLFNLISIIYFISISCLWGNPKYFAPCMISLSFFYIVTCYVACYIKNKGTEKEDNVKQVLLCAIVTPPIYLLL